MNYHCPLLHAWLPPRQCDSNRSRAKADFAIRCCEKCEGVEAITDQEPRELDTSKLKPPSQIHQQSRDSLAGLSEVRRRRRVMPTLPEAQGRYAKW